MTKLDAPYARVSITCKADETVALPPRGATHSSREDQTLEGALDEPDAMSRVNTSRLPALEAAFQASKLKGRTEALKSEKKFGHSMTGGTIASVRFTVPRGGDEISPENHSTQSEEPEFPKRTLRKHLSGQTGKDVAKALQIGSERQQVMSKSANLIYEDMLSQGASTAEALDYVKRFEEEGYSDRLTPISYTGLSLAERRSRMNAKGDGLINRNGVSETNTRDKSSQPFRIIKYESIYEGGEAMDRNERNPIKSKAEVCPLAMDDEPLEETGHH